MLGRSQQPDRHEIVVREDGRDTRGDHALIQLAAAFHRRSSRADVHDRHPRFDRTVQDEVPAGTAHPGVRGTRQVRDRGVTERRQMLKRLLDARLGIGDDPIDSLDLAVDHHEGLPFGQGRDLIIR